MCLLWDFRFACDDHGNVKCWPITTGAQLIRCANALANPEIPCNKTEHITNVYKQVCLMHFEEKVFRPSTRKNGRFTLSVEERGQADRIFNTRYDRKLVEKLDRDTWMNVSILGHENNDKLSLFPIDRPLSKSDFGWLVYIERVLHARLVENCVDYWDTPEPRGGNNLQPGDNDNNKNPPYVPWEPSQTEAQILIYYRVVYALFMAYATFWAKLLEMNAPLFRQYYPQLAPDRKPKVKLVWERLQHITTHVEPSDLPPDDRECMICQETFSERPRVAALQPWHTRLHDGFDSPLKLPCPHKLGSRCLYRWIEKWYDKRSNQPLRICTLCRKGFGVGRSKDPFEDGWEEYVCRGRDPREVKDAAIWDEINKNPSPWWLDFLRGD
ncbi:hypothetical protein HYFRA_00005009 [Hymenoscyphus fraxineus]|uniref:RING-type domain-containing protein n=1 Tax=Hymenoscyphus fraxineus TaxID=746836 RepID=A0A9N9KNT6_9HELO|nr:hypothetical protein HYFRA_00005009 [Hymenoscyphus fraxineus]